MQRFRPGRPYSVCVSLLFVHSAFAASAPVISGITDAASFGPRLAPGGLATIFGTDLASSGNVTASSFPLLTNLGGATVTIGGTAAPILYASPTQVNFQVPSATKTGSIAVTVTGPGGTSSSVSVTVTSSAPAIIQYGTNHAVAQNNVNGSVTLNSTSNQAAAGSTVTVYLVGIGAVNNAVTDGTATPTATSTAKATSSATIGAQAATISFLGLTPTLAGLAQANIVVPTLPSGDYPLTITVGGYVSTSAVISVSGSGSYTSPLIQTGSVSFANTANSSIALYSNVAYICGANRIVMVDVTDPTNPAYVGEFGDSVLAGNGQSCSINLNVAVPYLVEIYGNPDNAESFAIYNLAAPKSPVLLDIATTTWQNMTGLTFAGNYGFTTTSYITYNKNNAQITSQNGDFIAFDFTNPAAPVYLGALQPSTAAGSGDLNQKPFAEVVNQAYALVASSSATGSVTTGAEGVLDVVYVGTPATPTPVGQLLVSGPQILMSFDVSGSTLLAAGNTTLERNPGTPDFDFTGYLTLTTVNVSNFTAPVQIQNFTTSLAVNGTFHVSAFTNGVFAIINKSPVSDDFGPSMLMIVDARTPSAILLYPFQYQFGLSGIVATTSGYLLAPAMNGLYIYQLQLT